MKSRVVAVVATASLAMSGTLVGGAAGAAVDAGPADPGSRELRLGLYLVHAHDRSDLDALTRAGAYVEEFSHDRVLVSADRAAIKRVRAAGYQAREVKPQGAVEAASGRKAEDFPPGYEGYHTYAEMVDEIDKAVADHPEIISKFSVGKSHEGRDIWAVKISDNVGQDESEPEALVTHGQHAREHLTIEQGLYTMNLLTDGYASDSAIKSLVDGRELTLVLNVNPDGSEFDYAGGELQMWRKNRQPNSGSDYVGTDLNRNWGYKFGCCGGSSGNPGSETYRGESAFSAPETDVVRDYVDSRVIDGKQQITAAIDVHTFSELVLWPYGYTYDDVPDDMTQEAHDIHVALGKKLADLNGYTPEQASDLYITDGTIDDWLYGEHKIINFTFELYPKSSNPGFYPKDTEIDRETARNKDAFLTFFDYADCPSRIIDKPC